MRPAGEDRSREGEEEGEEGGRSPGAEDDGDVGVDIFGLALSFFERYDGRGSIRPVTEVARVRLRSLAQDVERAPVGTRRGEAQQVFVEELSVACPGWASWGGLSDALCETSTRRASSSAQAAPSAAPLTPADLTSLCARVEDGHRRAHALEWQLARLIARRAGVSSAEARGVAASLRQRLSRTAQDDGEEERDEDAPEADELDAQHIARLWADLAANGGEGSVGDLSVGSLQSPRTPGSLLHSPGTAAAVVEVRRLADRLRVALADQSALIVEGQRLVSARLAALEGNSSTSGTSGAGSTYNNSEQHPPLSSTPPAPPQPPSLLSRLGSMLQLFATRLPSPLAAVVAWVGGFLEELGRSAWGRALAGVAFGLMLLFALWRAWTSTAPRTRRK